MRRVVLQLKLGVGEAGPGPDAGCGDDSVVCNWCLLGDPSSGQEDRRTGRGGLIRHVTSDTRSLITLHIAHI